jgi:uncharacterized membrane protein YhaH (DUF805 family)
MNWAHLLTSIDGRINRKPFWIATLCLLVPELVAALTMEERASSIVSLLLTYPNFAVFAKRGHDRNASAWIAGVCFAGVVVLDLLTLFGLTGTQENPSTLYYVVGIPVGVLALVLLIDFGFRRGTAGPNQYGPDPLATS